MNVLAYFPDTLSCAQYLDDRRLINMVRETAQILSTARLLRGLPAPYKATHSHHPVVVWAKQKYERRVWLAHLLRQYAIEYRMRFRKSHKSWDAMEPYVRQYLRKPEPTLTHFANCAAHGDLGISYKHLRDVHLAYRLYVRKRWMIENAGGYEPRFTNRKAPKVKGVIFKEL